MSSFRLSDYTVAGAYVNAVEVARESDRRSARHHPETRHAGQSKKTLPALIKRVISAVGGSTIGLQFAWRRS